MADEPELVPIEEAPELPRQLHHLADEYAIARVRLEQALDAVKGPREAFEQAERALFDALENQNLTAVRSPAGYFRRDVTVDAQVLDRQEFAEWAKAHMPEILLPNYQRLSKLVRDALGAGAKRREPEDAFGLGVGQIPPGVDYNPRRGIAWTRTRGGAANSAPNDEKADQ